MEDAQFEYLIWEVSVKSYTAHEMNSPFINMPSITQTYIRAGKDHYRPAKRGKTQLCPLFCLLSKQKEEEKPTQKTSRA